MWPDLTIQVWLFYVMAIEISEIYRSDVSSVVAMLREFAEFENLSEYCEITDESLANAMFGQAAFVSGLIARNDGDAVGYALFYPSFSSFRGQQGFYLEDLYVKKEHRGRGLGEMMIREIARLAAKRGFERIDFQVLQWNTPAINFYKKLGAVSNEDERHFKFDGEEFTKLSEPPV